MEKLQKAYWDKDKNESTQQKSKIYWGADKNG
jgi:hypothetical protein